VPGDTERSVRSPAALMRAVERLAGPERALSAAPGEPRGNLLVS
jgi:hypothetical protein